MFDIQFYNCLHTIICLRLFFKIKHGNVFQNLTYCSASVRTIVITNLVHVFQMEILFPLWWEHLLTHMALLLSLADVIYHFTGFHLVNMSGYVSPRLADRTASLTTHQARAATHVFVAPMLHQFPHWLNLKSTPSYIPSPSCLLVVLVLKAQHWLPGRLNTADLPHTHIWKLWFVFSVTSQHTNMQLLKTFSYVLTRNFRTATNADLPWTLSFLKYVLDIIIPSIPCSSTHSVSMRAMSWLRQLVTGLWLWMTSVQSQASLCGVGDG